MDATEAAAMTRLGEREKWPVGELPVDIDADMLRCLDMAELVEAASVVLVNQQKRPGDTTRPAESRGRWFSPMKQPDTAGGWDRICAAPPLGTEQPESPRADVKKFPMDDFGGYFPKQSRRIVTLSVPKRTPSFYVRLTERGRAELARVRRRGAESVATPTDSDRGRASTSERLRQLGIDCAAMIARDPDAWTDAAAWLRTLPMCWAIVERHHGIGGVDDHREPLLIVGLDGLPVSTDDPPVHQFGIYDNEAETTRIQGASLRRLLTAWKAISHRFLLLERSRDRYFDFGVTDARRIVLLAALTLNRDFGGSVVGLNYPWEHPADCGASFEGRGWAWASLTSGLFAEPTMLDLIETATDYLRRMTPTGGQDSGIGYLRVYKDGLERVSRTIESITPLGEQLRELIAAGPTDPRSTKDTDWRDVQRRLLELYERGERYTSVAKLAKRLGCANATVQKAIKDSAKLTGWQARYAKPKGAPRATSINEIVTDNAEQTREPDPAEEAEADDVDIVFARLMEEAEPNERAQLHEMSEEQRRQLVAIVRDDPDNYDRILGRRP